MNIASLIFLPDLGFLALTSFQSLNRPSLSFGSSSRISLRRQSLSVSRPRLRPPGNIHSRSRLLLTNKTRPRFAATTDPFEQLDVTLLQKHVLDPIFGIADPRTSQRINFVGGIRGTAELEKAVDCGEYAGAFSMYPTSIEDLMRIADAGGIMPPKSTWFEPKLRSGLVLHRF